MEMPDFRLLTGAPGSNQRFCIDFQQLSGKIVRSLCQGFCLFHPSSQKIVFICSGNGFHIIHDGKELFRTGCKCLRVSLLKCSRHLLLTFPCLIGQYLLQDSLDFTDSGVQTRLLDKIQALPPSQLELAESLIDTMLMQLA